MNLESKDVFQKVGKVSYFPKHDEKRHDESGQITHRQLGVIDRLRLWDGALVQALR